MLCSGYVSFRNLGNIIRQLCIIYECKEYYTSVIFGSPMGRSYSDVCILEGQVI